MEKHAIYKTGAARAAVLEAYKKALSAWPLPVEILELKTEQARTKILAWGPKTGSRPSLVLLHGSISNSAIWLGEAKDLAEDRRVYAVDLPGEPGLSEELRLDLRDQSYPLWLGQVLDGLEALDGLGRCPSLLGLSLGAWAGLGYALAQPGKLGALLLLSASGLAPARASFLPRAIWASLGGEKGNRRLMAALFGDLPPPDQGIELGLILSRGVEARMETPRLFTDQELGRLALPMGLLMGDKDIILDGPGSARRLKALCPGALVEVIPGAGHALLGQTPPLGELLKNIESRIYPLP